MRRFGHAALAAMAAVTLAACGGDGGSEDTKEGWQDEHGSLVAAFSRDLTDALNVINQGERTTTLNTCTQVQDDAREVRDSALPVPNAAVDTALRRSVEAGLRAAENCLRGGRETNADAVEEAQRQFAEARQAMDEAESAINVWE